MIKIIGKKIHIRKLKKLVLRKRSTILIIFIFSAITTIALFYFSQYRKSEEKLKVLGNQQEATKTEAAKLAEAVGKLMMLPEGETPTAATITNTDIDKLKDRSFFANAQEGDKVLIYTTAKKAILYRPSTNKIIEVAPINIGTSSAQASPSATQTSQPTFSLPTSIPQASPSSGN